jgi:hypothetical protein
MGEIIAEERLTPRDQCNCNENPPAHEQGDFHKEENKQSIT